jgi:hypothetical protein
VSGREHIALFEIDHWQRVASAPKALPAKGDPNVVGTPLIVGTPVCVVWHGAVLPDVERNTDGLEGGVTTRGGSVVIRGADGFGLRATDGGLRPPPPSSVEPSGIPTMPTDDPGPIDEAKGADAVAEAAQVPGAVAPMPPPSKSAVPDSPGSSFPSRQTLPSSNLPSRQMLPSSNFPWQQAPAKRRRMPRRSWAPRQL